MPLFVLSWCSQRWGVRRLWERGAWELIANAEAARRAGAHTSVALFCAFCDGGYSLSELKFFLCVRKVSTSVLVAVCTLWALPPSDALTHYLCFPASWCLRKLLGVPAIGPCPLVGARHLCRRRRLYTLRRSHTGKPSAALVGQ